MKLAKASKPILLSVFFLCYAGIVYSQQIAFPGAEGYGKTSVKNQKQDSEFMQIKRFRHIAIVAKDIDTMIHFYTNVLGFKLLRRFNNQSEELRKGIGVADAEAIMAHLSVPNTDVEIELFQFKNSVQISDSLPANATGYRHFSIVVKDLQETYNKLKQKKVFFLSEPITVKMPKEVAGLKFVYFRDPEGNIIELNQLP